MCTDWYHSVHTGTTVYTLVPQCTDWYHSVYTGTTVYTLVPHCTDWYHSVQICATVYTLVPQCTHWYHSVQTGQIILTALLCTGHIIAGDFDKSDVTGDNGTWNSHLGCGFLQPGITCCHWLARRVTSCHLLAKHNRCYMSLIGQVPLPWPFNFPSGWTSSSAEAVHQLQPNVQPWHNQRLRKSISSSYEL